MVNIRFENRVSDLTKIVVVTEGVLTRMLQSDNALEAFGLVIFDEFHERSLNADLALALCLQVQQLVRDDLRILIMSATIDGEKLSSLLNNAPTKPIIVDDVELNEEQLDIISGGDGSILVKTGG